MSRDASETGSTPADDTPSCHEPVLLAEIIELLEPKSGHIIVDGTLGGGGHARALARMVAPNGRVIGLDRDGDAIRVAVERQQSWDVQPLHASYVNLPEAIASIEIPAVDGILLDLGLSSDQLAAAERGFSFRMDGELDMRFDQERGEPAWRLLSRLGEKHIADLIYKYGEERYSRRIARAIVARRQDQPIRTTQALADLVTGCVPRDRKAKIHPATRTFQALRIAVNDELEGLQSAMTRLPGCLTSGGRLAVISYHSLEDRIVKNAFRQLEGFDIITRKPVRPSDAEIASNPRSRSARLRVIQRH